MTRDRVDGDQFTFTQDFLSRMLGVRRAGVCVAASSLRQMGLIDYHRGDIQLLDGHKLQDAACECYQRVKDQYDRLFRHRQMSKLIVQTY
jgi:hypothetical protein